MQVFDKRDEEYFEFFQYLCEGGEFLDSKGNLYAKITPIRVDGVDHLRNAIHLQGGGYGLFRFQQNDIVEPVIGEYHIKRCLCCVDDTQASAPEDEG